MVILGKIHNYEERYEEFSLFEYGISDIDDHIRMKTVAFPSSRIERVQLSSIYADHVVRLRYHKRPERDGVEECVIYLRFRSDNYFLEVSDSVDFSSLSMTGCSVKARNNEAGFNIVYNCNQIYLMPVRPADFVSDLGQRSYVGYRVVEDKDMSGRSQVRVDPVVDITMEVAAM